MTTTIVQDVGTGLAVSVRAPDSPTLSAFRQLFAPVRHKVDRPSRYVDILSGKKGEDNIKLGMLRDAVASGAPAKHAKTILDLEQTRYRTMLCSGVIPTEHQLWRRETEIQHQIDVLQIARSHDPYSATIRDQLRVAMRHYVRLLEQYDTRLHLDSRPHDNGNAPRAA
jgi:hypothetical protein